MNQVTTAKPLQVRPFNPEHVPLSRSNVKFTPVPGMPVDIEIGCGVGYHPIQYALANPGRQLYALERTNERFVKFQRRLQGHGNLDNLIPVRSEAVAWVTHQVPLESVDRYIFMYPNPYPGILNRHWHAMSFMQQVIATLKPGGTITMATNIESYFIEARQYFAEVWCLTELEARQVAASEQPRTHFEKKYLQRGDACFNFIVQKPAHQGAV